ncbi:hypothetical protein SDRG_06486 [Saprolegnia diclina VS20]|uniref:glucan endo-1,3-beta-D-glucosidase n=1 Tax=Saprolegnia diclina (strain VS20) TaxID=1156394 RepID=T0RV48_SAPDV|nr:hypothetical protein SDRG_06486 [Saprolegnia diclina VS20]EQC36383.1 hypothetical protein SDRG_06486 [Saprolegnia diclina VS20]|eukprot:XP_008610489.1 hypothetical protein SDRG_06486 [Saprolegnia diclina VS20]
MYSISYVSGTQLVTSLSEVDDFCAEKQAPRRWLSKRLLGLVTALVLVAIIVGVVTTCSATQDVTNATELRLGATALDMAIGYDTYQADQIDAHFAKIATRFSGVRSFQTWLPNNDNVIAAAARHDLVVYAGIWLRGGGVYARDVQAAIDGAWRHPGTVKAVFVGNEELSNGWSPDQLIRTINDVRAKFNAAGLGHIRLGTVQIDGDLLKYPQVADVCDIVGANMHAFFSSAPYSNTDPMRDTRARWDAIVAKFGTKAIITEVGWPFAGGSYGSHVASYEMGVSYFNAFSDWVRQGNGGPLPAYFMFHNNPSKIGFEAHFGLADANANWITSPDDIQFLLQTATGTVIYEMHKSLFAYVESPCANERWRFNRTTNQIVSISSGQCLDAYFANARFYVHVWPCDASNQNQLWTIDATSNTIKHRVHNNLCLDVDPTKADASVQVWSCHGGSNQQIRVVLDLPHLGLQSQQTKSVLVGSNDRIAFRNANRDASAAWTFLQSKHMLLHEASGMCLDGYEFKNGGAVHLWRCDATNGNQKWIYDSNTLQLRHGTRPEFCLDVGVGASPYLYACHGKNDPYISFQQFALVP